MGSVEAEVAEDVAVYRVRYSAASRVFGISAHYLIVVSDRTALVLRPGNAPVALGCAPDIVADDMGTVADRIVQAGAGRGPSPVRDRSAP